MHRSAVKVQSLSPGSLRCIIRVINSASSADALKASLASSIGVFDAAFNAKFGITKVSQWAVMFDGYGLRRTLWVPV